MPSTQVRPLPPAVGGDSREPTPAAPKGLPWAGAPMSWGGRRTELQPQMFPISQLEEAGRNTCAGWHTAGMSSPKGSTAIPDGQHEQVAERMALF